MIRMHAYENGHHGLAAFCDVCGEQITEHGFVVWNCDEEGRISEWRVIHQSRCDDPRFQYSMSLSAEWVYLGNSAGILWEDAKKEVLILREFV